MINLRYTPGSSWQLIQLLSNHSFQRNDLRDGGRRRGEKWSEMAEDWVISLRLPSFLPCLHSCVWWRSIPVPMKDIRARYSKQTFEVKSLHCLVLTTCLFLPSSRSLRLPSPAIAKSTTEARFAHETQLPMPLSSCSFYCSTSSRNGAPFALRSLMTGHCYDRSLFILLRRLH